MKDPLSRELEIQQVRLAIARTATEILRLEGVLAQMRGRQMARYLELGRQETFAKIIHPSPLASPTTPLA